ncbi:MAG: hypothetical protein JWN46_1827, partial [Acidimicrobiales bacterium]|nr:hypothetical protein [Acidimicrobiales bacterium]
DAAPRGHLVGLLLTSASPHAEVTIAPGAALEVPGAVAVLGGDDGPCTPFSVNPHSDDPELAPPETYVFNREARFVGDIVGLVVARDWDAARAMAAQVEQVERPLPAALNVAAALAPGAPLVRLTDAAATARDRCANIAYAVEVGSTAAEIDAALAVADQVVTGTYRVEPGPIGAMERIAAAAQWVDGRCLVWSTSQTPSVVPPRCAPVLGIDAAAIEVQPLYLGGGFGLKEEVFLEPLAAVASRAVGGAPVLVEATRAQVGALRRRHGAEIELRTGCRSDGTPVARSVRITLDAGAEIGHSSFVLLNAVGLAVPLYPAPVVRVEGTAVLTNTTVSGAFRGYGAGELAFALERHTEELARTFGVDPVEYRRRHVLRAGGVDPLNAVQVDSFASAQVCDELERHGWGSPLPNGPTDPTDPAGRWRRGRGVAHLAIITALTSAHYVDESEAVCRLDPDGRVVVETGLVEMGQGIHSTFASIVAERLGIDPARVRVEHLAPQAAPVDEGTFASRGTYVSGNAVAAATDALRAELLIRGAVHLGVAPSQCRVEGLVVVAAGQAVAAATLGPCRVAAVWRSPDGGLVSGAQMAEVAVDTWTGRVVVERVVSVHDVGRLVDRRLATGQVVGGVMQGIGMALTERLSHDESGHPVEVALFDQGLPTMANPTEVVPVFVGDGHARGLLGAKGLGEAPVVGVAAAIANAVRDATGIALDVTPFTPERVLAALDAASVAAAPAVGAVAT